VVKVDILAAPETASSILYGLYDILLLPGAAWPRVIRGEPGESLFDVRVVARTTEQFRCRSGAPVAPHCDLATANDAEVICIPNMTVPVGECPYGWFEEEVAWLKSRYDDGVTIATVCSGALILAETGLLSGEEATAHWAYEDTFRKFYPEIRFCPERILTFAGEGDRLVLAGGMSSWQDLALYLITRFLGPEHAVQASKFYVISDHTEGQLPYAALSQRIQADDQAIHQSQIWLRDNYGDPEAVLRMQEVSGLPRRSFSRRFRAATGFSPNEYVQAVRAEEAKNLLESSMVPTDDVAMAVGYQDERAFRRVFRKRTGLSPSAYRKRFHHSRFSQPH
jgi:transcriptional regulator GlxA family with amidase domain